MSATLTRSSLDSYLNLNVQNSNSVTQNNLQVSKNSDNGVDFAKALSILTSSANKTDSFKDSFSSNSGLSDTDDNYFLSQLSSAYQDSASDETEEVTANNRSSLEERFSVLNNSIINREAISVNSWLQKKSKIEGNVEKPKIKISDKSFEK